MTESSLISAKSECTCHKQNLNIEHPAQLSNGLPNSTPAGLGMLSSCDATGFVNSSVIGGMQAGIQCLPQGYVNPFIGGMVPYSNIVPMYGMSHVSGYTAGTLMNMQGIAGSSSFTIPGYATGSQIGLPGMVAGVPFGLSGMAAGVPFGLPGLVAGSQFGIQTGSTQINLPGAQVGMPLLTPGIQLGMPGISTSTQIGMPGLAAGTQFGMPGLAAGTQFGMPGLAAGTQFGMPGLAAGTQFGVPGHTAGTQFGMPGLAAGTQFGMPGLAAGTQFGMHPFMYPCVNPMGLMPSFSNGGMPSMQLQSPFVPLNMDMLSTSNHMINSTESKNAIVSTNQFVGSMQPAQTDMIGLPVMQTDVVGQPAVQTDMIGQPTLQTMSDEKAEINKHAAVHEESSLATVQISPSLDLHSNQNNLVLQQPSFMDSTLLTASNNSQLPVFPNQSPMHLACETKPIENHSAVSNFVTVADQTRVMCPSVFGQPVAICHPNYGYPYTMGINAQSGQTVLFSQQTNLNQLNIGQQTSVADQQTVAVRKSSNEAVQ